MTTLAGVEAEAGLDTLADVVAEVEMETLFAHWPEKR